MRHKLLSLVFALLAPQFLSGCIVLLPFIPDERTVAVHEEQQPQLEAEQLVQGAEPAAQNAVKEGAVKAVKLRPKHKPAPEVIAAPPRPTAEERRIQLVEQLRTGTTVTRTHAATDLGFMGREARSAIGALAIALKTDDCKWVRRAAAKALGKIGSHEVIAPLTAALNDRNRWVAHSAERALQKLGAWESARR